MHLSISLKLELIFSVVVVVILSINLKSKALVASMSVATDRTAFIVRAHGINGVHPVHTTNEQESEINNFGMSKDQPRTFVRRSYAM